MQSGFRGVLRLCHQRGREVQECETGGLPLPGGQGVGGRAGAWHEGDPDGTTGPGGRIQPVFRHVRSGRH